MCKRTLRLEDMQKIHNNLKTTKDKTIISALLDKGFITDEDNLSLKSIGLDGLEEDCKRYYIENIVLFTPEIVYKDSKANVSIEKDSIKLEILWTKGLGIDVPRPKEYELMCPMIGGKYKWSRPRKLPKGLDDLLYSIADKAGKTGFLHIISKDDVPIIYSRCGSQWVLRDEINSETYAQGIVNKLCEYFTDIPIKEIYWQENGVGKYIQRVNDDGEYTISVY